MCNGCWNVKTFEEKKRNNINCDGQEMLTMNIDELKENLTKEWLKTQETHFNVFKKAISNATFDEITFNIFANLNGQTVNTHLHVQLV